MGEVLKVNGYTLQVTAILEDLPTNTIFPGAAGDGRPEIFISSLAPFSSIKTWSERAFTTDIQPGGMVYGGSFVRLKAAASIDVVQSAMPTFVRNRIPRDLLGEVQMRLIPLADLRIPDLNEPSYKPLRDRFWAMIFGVVGIGALIVLAAVINYVNAMTARGARRAVEVGVRKATGAARRQLMIQFMGESIITTGMAMMLAVGLVAMVLPSAEAILDRTMPFYAEPLLAGAIVAAGLVTGLMAGAYPAFILAELRPSVVLKAGGASARGSSRVRHVLVVAQFAILIGVTAVTAVIYRQTNYAMNQIPGFTRSQTVIVSDGCRAALRNEIQKLSGVTAVTCGDIRGAGYGTTAAGADGRQISGEIVLSPLDPDFIDFFDLKPVAGEVFTRNTAPSAGLGPDVVVNQSAARYLGFPTPAAAVGQSITVGLYADWPRREDQMRPAVARIVGVVPDYVTNVENPAIAYAYYLDTNLFEPDVMGSHGRLSIKLDGQNMPATLRAIDEIWASAGNQAQPIPSAANSWTRLLAVPTAT